MGIRSKLKILKNLFLNKNNNLTERFSLLKKIGLILIPEYKFKWPQMDWWKSEKFNSYLDEIGEKHNNNADRRWMVSQLLRLTKHIEGSTAEVGAYKGAMSLLICESNSLCIAKKNHYIFDSFQGLSSPSDIDGNYWSDGDLSSSEEILHKNLNQYKGSYSCFKGWIPETFNEVSNENFSFIHIDVDLYNPTYSSFEFFYSRMNEGAILVCDDYGSSLCPGATKACEEFLQSRKESMIELSGGGGFFIKGTRTAKNLYR